MEIQPSPQSLEVDEALIAPQHTTIAVLWRFTDAHGRWTVCHLIERRDLGIVRMRLDYDGYPVITETHRDMGALLRRSREYYERAIAEGWTEVRDGALSSDL